jgi:transposase
MFNPIENVWSSIKSTVKRLLCSRLSDILQGNLPNLSIKEHRLRALEELVDEGIRNFDSRMCSFFSRLQIKMVDAVNLVDMEF